MFLHKQAHAIFNISDCVNAYYKLQSDTHDSTANTRGKCTSSYGKVKKNGWQMDKLSIFDNFWSTYDWNQSHKEKPNHSMFLHTSTIWA